MNQVSSAIPQVRFWPLAGLVACLVAVSALVFWPNGWTINRLVVRLYFDLGFYHWADWLALDDPNRFDFSNLLNICLMIPVALLLVVGLPRMWAGWAVTAVAAVSCLIELGQLLFLDRRLASTIDVITNVIGGLLGALAGWALNRSLARKHSDN